MLESGPPPSAPEAPTPPVAPPQSPEVVQSRVEQVRPPRLTASRGAPLVRQHVDLRPMSLPSDFKASAEGGGSATAGTAPEELTTQGVAAEAAVPPPESGSGGGSDRGGTDFPPAPPSGPEGTGDAEPPEDPRQRLPDVLGKVLRAAGMPQPTPEPAATEGGPEAVKSSEPAQAVPVDPEPTSSFRVNPVEADAHLAEAPSDPHEALTFTDPANLGAAEGYIEEGTGRAVLDYLEVEAGEGASVIEADVLKGFAVKAAGQQARSLTTVALKPGLLRTMAKVFDAENLRYASGSEYEVPLDLNYEGAQNRLASMARASEASNYDIRPDRYRTPEEAAGMDRSQELRTGVRINVDLTSDAVRRKLGLPPLPSP